jgi:outer membrane immunogenic protein
MEGIPVSKSVALSVAGMAVAGALIASPALADGGYPIYGDGGLKDEVLLAPPPITWTGFYLGAHVGGGFADSDWTSRFESGDIVHFGDTFSHNPQGWLGGGQIGYNFQTGQAVWGIEATLSGADIDDTSRSRFDDVFLSTDIDMFWTVTGRLGYDWGRVLTYVKGGYAGANVELSAADRFDLITGFDRFSEENTHHGWTIGGGLEFLATPNVVLGLEYNFYDFGEESYGERFRFVTGRDPVEEDLQMHTVTARLSWKFNRFREIAPPLPPLK